MSKPRSLVLITVDCLRADHLGFLGYKHPTTPFLDVLAKESLIFENAVVAGAPTYYSFPAIMASRYPLALGRDILGLAPDEPTLASVLHETGYATAAFVAANPYLTKHFGYSASFEVFEDFLGHDPKATEPDCSGKTRDTSRKRLNHWIQQTSAKIGLGFLHEELYFRYGQRVAKRFPKSFDQLRRFPAADVVISHAREWIQQIGPGVPFFLWLHLMDPHGPYYPTKESLDLMKQGEMTAERACYLNSYWNRSGLNAKRFNKHREAMFALYDSGIRWVDQQVKVLVDDLQRLELWNDCAFVVTADHGEEFLEHGSRMHAPPKLNEELVHVPLLIRAPGVHATKFEPPFSLIDLSPTLLDLLELPTPADFRGNSRWQQINEGKSWEQDVVIECIAGCSNPFRREDRRGSRLLAVRGKRYKLVLDLHSSAEQLFDLEADPKELHPLPAGTEKPVRRRMLERARKHIFDSLSSRDLTRRTSLLLRNITLEPGQKT